MGARIALVGVELSDAFSDGRVSKLTRLAPGGAGAACGADRGRTAGRNDVGRMERQLRDLGNAEGWGQWRRISDRRRWRYMAVWSCAIGS